MAMSDMLDMDSSPIQLIEQIAEVVPCLPYLLVPRFRSELSPMINVILLVSHKCDSPPLSLYNSSLRTQSHASSIIKYNITGITINIAIINLVYLSDDVLCIQ